MRGLLIGIILSRTFGGIIGDIVGWRAVYFMAAGLTLILAVVIRSRFPENLAISQISYLELFKSIPGLIKTQRPLRESTINGFFMFGAYSVFWTSLIFFLKSPHYEMGARETGLFGLAGIAGVLAAPIIGNTADHRSPRNTVGIGLIFASLAFTCFTLLGSHIWGLVAGVLILDLGNQSCQISNLARINALGGPMRSRNTTVYMVVYYIGGATGSFLGTLFWQNFGCMASAGSAFHFFLPRFNSFLVYGKQAE
jgi:predicted MFS family arabinose efflux permease